MRAKSQKPPRSHKIKPKNRFTLLPAGAVRLKGPLGRALDLTVENRLKQINYRCLVDPFRDRSEHDKLWRCEFWGKIVRSAIAAWYSTQDEGLLALIRDTVADLLTTQTSDGCITTYPAEYHTQSFDIWGRKYVLLGLLRYYAMVEPDGRVKKACCGVVDHLMTQIGPGRKAMTEVGTHLGMSACSILGAIVGVYRISGEKKYLDYAEWIAESGCSLKHNIFEEARKRTPPEQIANGKAYEMMSCFQGLSELYLELPKPDYRDAVARFYALVRDREIFVTGLGGLKDQCGEFWYDGKFKQTLADAGKLGETCITTTWIHYAERVLNLSGDPTVGDELERAFYNGLLGAMTPDGTGWTHMNPTPLAGSSVKRAAVDQMTLNRGTPFYGHDCCLAQGPEGLALAPLLAVLADEKGLAVNAYEALSASFSTPSGRPASLEIAGDYPRRGQVRLTLALDRPVRFRLKLRIPAWWTPESRIRCDGKPVIAKPGTYLDLDRKWQPGDGVDLDFDLSARQEDDPGGGPRKAVLCGPVVLAQDSRLGGVDAPIAGIAGMQDAAAPEDPEAFYLVKKLTDGSRLCDYASAGNRFSEDNTLCVWLRTQ